MASESFSQADVQRMIDEALAEQRSGAQPATVAAHAAGPGTEVAPTWSAYDQVLAARGEHPWQRGENADHLAHPDRTKVVRGVTQPK